MDCNDILIERYEPSRLKEWDDFVESSKNGTFLFNRAYMDYHSDRFEDNSLLIYKKKQLYCLLPANRKSDTIYSHQGLTYGGLIMSPQCRTEEILTIFQELGRYLQSEGISKLVYMPVPHIYHKIPAEEDLYALFRLGGSVISRNISSTIFLPDTLEFSTLRKRCIKKAMKEGLECGESEDYETFWKILESNLNKRYGVAPVHSLQEISYLHRNFPENIKLYTSYNHDGEILAGVVIYDCGNVAHAQYISASEKGKETGALDLLFSYLINKVYAGVRYFDFGISTEDGGNVLNESLISQKEGFGGRGICYDTYELKIPLI